MTAVNAGARRSIRSANRTSRKRSVTAQQPGPRGPTRPPRESYLLDEEDTKVWQDHWDMGGPPAVFVYGRDGKLARRFVNDFQNTFTYADVEKYVKTLLPRGGQGGK